MLKVESMLCAPSVQFHGCGSGVNQSTLKILNQAHLKKIFNSKLCLVKGSVYHKFETVQLDYQNLLTSFNKIIFLPCILKFTVLTLMRH